MGGCTVRGVMTSMDPVWIIMECLQMTHHPLTSRSISFPLLSIFRMHLTRLVVNTHHVALTSVNFMSDCEGLSSSHSSQPVKNPTFSHCFRLIVILLFTSSGFCPLCSWSEQVCLPRPGLPYDPPPLYPTGSHQ